MAVEVILPKVDMDMASAKILKWFAGEGEQVKKGAALFEIETDKAAMEIDAPADGLLQQVVKEGEIAEIGSAVGYIYNEGEKAVVPVAKAATPAAAAEIVAAPPPPPPAPVASTPSNGLRATPLARRLAREAKLDLKSLNGSGPHGRIVAEDVHRAAAKPAVTAAQFHLTTTCNIEILIAARDRFNAHGNQLNTIDFIAKAFAIAGDIGGVAVDTSVLENGKIKSLSAISAELKNPAASGNASAAIIDLGPYGLEQGTAIVNPPHTMALVLGAPIQNRMICTLCVASALDHKQAAALLQAFRKLVEDPLLMLA